MTRSIIYRIVLSLLVGACIAFASDTPKGSISDTLFTVLGIVYSIVMSLLITFSTSGIKNAEYRKVIKKLINKKNLANYSRFLYTRIVLFEHLYRKTA